MTHRISVLRQNKTPLSFKCDNLSRNIPFPFSFATKPASVRRGRAHSPRCFACALVPCSRAPRPCPVARSRCARTARVPLRGPVARAPPVSRCAVPLRAPRPCGLAVGRDVPIAPPRHRRGARLGIPRPLARAPRHYTRSLPGRRDRDIAPYRHYTRALPTCIARGGSPSLCFYTSRSKALYAPLC